MLKGPSTARFGLALIVAFAVMSATPSAYAEVDKVVTDDYQRRLPRPPESSGSLPFDLEGFFGGGGGGGGDEGGRKSMGEKSRDGAGQGGRIGRGGGGGSGSRARRSSVPNESLSDDFDAPSFAGLGNAVFWVLLAIALVVVLLIIVRMRNTAKEDDEEDDEDEEDEEIGDVVAEILRRPLEDHEKLAANGQYREAMHALLLGVLIALIKSSRIKLNDALTSRELLERFKIHDEERKALQELVHAVERVFFGTREADEVSYERCVKLTRIVTPRPAETETREAA